MSRSQSFRAKAAFPVRSARSIKSATSYGCALAAMLALAASPLRAERWTSLAGNKTVEARFIGMWGNSVVLELPGPRRVTVNVDHLVAESRIQARRMAEEQQQRRDELRQQIVADAKEAAAPAPTPLPKPPTPPPYQSFSGGSVLDLLNWIEQQDRNGHGLLAAYDALPTSYQNDLERMVRLSVAKLDMQGTRQILNSIHSIGDLIVTRQRWVFSYPRLDAMDPDSKQTFEKATLALGGLIRDGLDPAQLKLEDLQSTPLRAWLLDLDTRIAPHYAVMKQQLEEIDSTESSFEVKEETDATAVVELVRGEIRQPINLANVDGKWMPADLNQERWGEMMASWEESLANVPDGTVLTGVAAQAIPLAIDPVLQPAMVAKSSREFHAAMDGWMALGGLAAQQVASMGFGPSARRGSMYGYEEDMYEEDMYGEEMDDYEEQMNREMSEEFSGSGSP